MSSQPDLFSAAVSGALEPSALKAAELRLGRWQNVLNDVLRCNALIVDPPYSEKTHSGHDKSTKQNRIKDGNARNPLAYPFWAEADVAHFVQQWVPRTQGWFVAFTDHVLEPLWIKHLEQCGLYVFSPLCFMHPGSRVRMRGDGPSQWSVRIVCARPKTKEFSNWGALPGGYCLPRALPALERARPVRGGKPLWLMRELVRDYSRLGDLVVDPCAGAATTLLAAQLEGRRAVGAECDEQAHLLGQCRLTKPSAEPLDVEEAS